MPRIRSIKPDFFKSEDVAALPLRARLLWIGLWTQCDDHGRYKDSVRLIKGDVWPLDDVSLRDIDEDLSILEKERRLVRYEVDGKRYLAVVNWHAHQSINRPGRPKYPAPPVALGSADRDHELYCSTGECVKANRHAIVPDHSLSTHGDISEDQYCGYPVDNRGSAGQSTVDQRTEPSLSTHAPLTEGSHQEGKGKEGKGGDARAGASGQPHAPPPERCPQHLDDPDPPACGRCADARRARQRWDAAAAQRDRDTPRCRTHRGEPAHNCGRCRADRLAGDA